jgi:hypothetical protein
MALRLEWLHATCVTVEMALKYQKAERDEEIACCLMRNVTESLHDQTEVLQGIVRGLERSSVAGQAVRP